MSTFNNMRLINFSQFIKLYNKHFNNNISDFSNYFAIFNNDFTNDLNNLIEQYDNQKLYIYDSAFTYSQVKDKSFLIAEGKKLLQLLFGYATIAFDDKQEVNQFGKSDYQKAIRREDLLVDLLIYAWDAASEPTNNAVLTSAGMKQADIDRLKEISEDISSLQAEIYKRKASGKKINEHRNKLMEEIKKKFEYINKASKIIYRDNPAKLELFKLYPKVQRSKKKPKDPVKTA